MEVRCYYPTECNRSLNRGRQVHIVDKRSIRGCRDIGTSEKEELDSFAEALAHVLHL